tara:strand:+ start:8231 stop:8887 length:657 start_codon:yes stop_codon:yes gene_type:complete
MLEILYQDDFICVVNKPSGYVVHRTAGAEKAPVLVQSLRDQVGKKVYPVHRLDRATSGCVAFAFDSDSARLLQTALSQGKKKYYALCLGNTEEHMRIDRPLKNENKIPQAALSEFKKLESLGEYSLLEAQIFTGRKHQIRRHLSHLGHHVVGDVNHGKGWLNRRFREKYNFHRMFLHAHLLEFEHPVYMKSLNVSAAMPSEFEHLISKIRDDIPSVDN